MIVAYLPTARCPHCSRSHPAMTHARTHMHPRKEKQRCSVGCGGSGVEGPVVWVDGGGVERVHCMQKSSVRQHEAGSSMHCAYAWMGNGRDVLLPGTFCPCTVGAHNVSGLCLCQPAIAMGYGCPSCLLAAAE